MHLRQRRVNAARPCVVGMTTSTFHARRRAVLAALIASGAISLTACGAGEDPAAPQSGGQPNQVSDSDFSSARDAYDLKLAGCLREKGFDVKDPAPGQGIQEASPEINAAASKCMAELGDPPSVAPSKEQEAEQREAQLKQTACLREKGYEVEDPSPNTPLSVPENVTQKDLDTCFAG
jgi:hypothetical protein